MELLERQAELKILHAAFEQATNGHGSIVLVSGEAGIGKTSLLRTFASEIDTAARIYFGTCENMISPRPLGPFRDIVRDSAATFDYLAADADREMYIDVFMRELRLAGRPALLIIDDVQWADDASLDVLRYLGRRIGDLPAQICLSYRPPSRSVSHPLPQLIGALTGPGTTRLELAGLSDDAVAAAATQAGLDPQTLISTVGGNPFYLAEALAAPNTSVPPTVRDATAAHLGKLKPVERQIVEIISQMPLGADWESLEAIARPEMASASMNLGNLVDVTDGRFRFRHDIARRAVSALMSDSQRVHVNRSILGFLVSQDVEPALLVHHAAKAHDRAAIARHAPRAAEKAAAAGAHRDVVRLCQLALDLDDLLDQADVGWLHSTAAHSSYMANEFGAAASHADSAVLVYEASTAESSRLAEACLIAARMQTMTGDTVGARRYATRAIEVLESGQPSRVLARAYGTIGGLDAIESRNSHAVDWCTKAITLAEQVDDQPILAHALIYLGMAKIGLGDDAGLGDIKRAIEVADRIGHAEYLFRAAANLGVMLVWAGRHKDAIPHVQMSIRVAADHNMAWGVFHGRSQEANIDIFLGQWDCAEARLRELLEADGDPGGVVTLPLALLGRILVRRGDPEGRALIDRAWEIAVASGQSFRIAAAGQARIEAAWLAGDPAVVQELANDVLPIAVECNLRYFRGEVLRCLKRVGLRAEPFPGCHPALAAGILGEHDRAAELWAQAGNRYQQALELTESSDEQVAFDGLRMLDEMRAAGAAATVRRQLRARNIRGVPRGPRPQTRKNEAGLTPRQLDVLRQLAANRTNTEIAEELFVSPRTVDSHVGAILSKLQAESRGDAVRKARVLGLLLEQGQPEPR